MYRHVRAYYLLLNIPLLKENKDKNNFLKYTDRGEKA